VKPITLRNLPPQVARLVQARAKADRTSLNRTVIKILEEAIADKTSGETLHHDLDHLVGKWSSSEADMFDAALGRQRQIDPELWK